MPRSIITRPYAAAVLGPLLSACSAWHPVSPGYLEAVREPPAVALTDIRQAHLYGVVSVSGGDALTTRYGVRDMELRDPSLTTDAIEGLWYVNAFETRPVAIPLATIGHWEVSDSAVVELKDGAAAARARTVLVAPTVVHDRLVSRPLRLWDKVRVVQAEGGKVQIKQPFVDPARPDTLFGNHVRYPKPLQVPLDGVVAIEVLLPDKEAQHERPAMLGYRVRVTAPSLGLKGHKAIFQQFSGDTLILDSRRVPLSAVTRLQVYAGRGSAGVAGALGGAAFFGMIGGAFWGGFCEGFKGSAAYDCTGEMMAGVGIGALGGALLGGVIGSLAGSDRWQTVQLDQLQLRLNSPDAP